MTLTDPLHFDETVGELRRRGIEVRHVTLMAQPEPLRKRIGKRLDWPWSKRWVQARADKGLEALANHLFAPHVWTDGHSIGEVGASCLRRSLGRVT